MSLVAIRLRKLRKKSGFTQIEVANKLGLGIRQIYRYENGVSEPTPDTLMKLAEFFNVSTDELLGHTPKTVHRRTLTTASK